MIFINFFRWKIFHYKCWLTQTTQPQSMTRFCEKNLKALTLCRGLPRRGLAAFRSGNAFLLPFLASFPFLFFSCFIFCARPVSSLPFFSFFCSCMAFISSSPLFILERLQSMNPTVCSLSLDFSRVIDSPKHSSFIVLRSHLCGCFSIFLLRLNKIDKSLHTPFVVFFHMSLCRSSAVRF